MLLGLWLRRLSMPMMSIIGGLGRKLTRLLSSGMSTMVLTGYDFVGNVLAITDSVGNTTSYTYDALNRQITDTNSLSKTRSFGYDAVGSLVSSIDRNGRKRTYSYDVLNRQVAENWLDGSNAISRTFGYTYDAVGHLLTSTDPDSKYTYTYDLVDRVKNVDNTGTIGVPTVKLAYSYDAVGNLVSTTDAINGVSAGTNAYTYDVLNRATRITQSGTGVQGKRIDMSYDAANQMTGLSRYGDVAGLLAVIDTSYNFDAVGRLTNLTHKKGTTTIASYGLTYDAANRITQSSGTDGTQDYSYDVTNQLTAVDHTTQVDEAYSYDANGNRTNAGYGTGTNNRLLTDGVYSYSYDDEGNRTKRVEISTGKVTEYAWDYRNRLASVVFKDAGGVVTKTIEYAYDVDNRRIGKKVDTSTSLSASGVVVERYVYDGSDIALVFDGAGVQTHRYLYGTGVDQILADERGGSVVWALADNQGTIRDLVNNAGVILNHINYDSFGRVVSQTSPGVEFRFGYTGREQDGETGLDYYRARYYDSSVGRFISEDPIGFKGGDGNLSRYVGNSPTNFTDPSGLCSDSPVEAIAKLIAVEVFGAGIRLLGDLGGGIGNGLQNVRDNIFSTPRDGGTQQQPQIYTFPNPNRNRLHLGDDPYRQGTPGAIPHGTPGFNNQHLFPGSHVLPGGSPEDNRWLSPQYMESDTGGNNADNPFLTPDEFKQLPNGGTVDPNKIRFSQDSINYNFKPPYENQTIDNFAKLIKNGDIKTDPIRIVEKDGKVYTLDNRRLQGYQQAGVDVNYNKLNHVPKRQEFKFTTKNDGTSINIRNKP